MPADYNPLAGPSPEELVYPVVDKRVDEWIQRRIEVLNYSSLILILIASAAMTEVSSFDSKAWEAEWMGGVYVMIMMFVITVTAYCAKMLTNSSSPPKMTS